MARLSHHHEELDEHGVGKCSVPMWMNGLPADFCDKPAHGKALPFHLFRPGTQNRYDGYVPALACYWHGGPKAPAGRDAER